MVVPDKFDYHRYFSNDTCVMSASASINQSCDTHIMYRLMQILLLINHYCILGGHWWHIKETDSLFIIQYRISMDFSVCITQYALKATPACKTSEFKLTNDLHNSPCYMTCFVESTMQHNLTKHKAGTKTNMTVRQSCSCHSK